MHDRSGKTALGSGAKRTLVTAGSIDTAQLLPMVAGLSRMK